MTGAPALRTATPADRAAIEALLAAAELPTVGIATLLADHAADFVVATDPADPEQLVAVAGLERCGARVALLRSVAVHPSWRSHGLARDAVRALLAHADDAGLDALYLLTTTAQEYFPRFGFTRVARTAVPDAIAATAEFTDACPASAIVMVRPVRSTATVSA
ncbi:MAG: arsenic resistance N-acetyltransferase ArsN2 [Gemmatimonadaceae bacterium]|nr:arsenic resistance N-acetyltransferase ArsN2 [Gemmatimonadaceae bacterium]